MTDSQLAEQLCDEMPGRPTGVLLAEAMRRAPHLPARLVAIALVKAQARPRGVK